MMAARAYAQTQKATASPQRLMVLLFQRALFLIRDGAKALEEGKNGTLALSKACDIVVELMGTLDRNRAPQLADTLGAVYEFVAVRLTQATAGRDAKKAREAERAFAPIADAFSQAVASLDLTLAEKKDSP
jgi:flagellar secretion chaperone FliS